MGLYATTTGLQTKMVGTVFDSATTSLASACIYDAENEVKKYLSKRYDLETAYFTTATSIPPLVRSLTETLAVGFMTEHMARGSKEAIARGAAIQKRAMDNLTMIQEGKSQLFDTAGALIPEDSTGSDWQVLHNGETYAPTFDEGDPKNWKVDRDKLTDIADEKD